MMLSLDRQNYLTHLLLNFLKKEGFISCQDNEKALMIVRKIFNQCLQDCAEMDQKVKNKITSLKRKITEESPEWQVLYNNYLEEEMIRKGLTPLKHF